MIPDLKRDCLKCGGSLYEDIPGVMFICRMCGGCSYTVEPEPKTKVQNQRGVGRQLHRRDVSGVKPKPFIVMNAKNIGSNDKSPSWKDENAAAYRYKYNE